MPTPRVIKRVTVTEEFLPSEEDTELDGTDERDEEDEQEQDEELDEEEESRPARKKRS